MASVDTSIEVNVPVSTAYNQWTQLESFPRFMDNIESVNQIDDTTVEFKGEIGGVERRWKARVVEQTPDERIAWKTIEGTQNDGTVLFEPVDANRTRIKLMLDYEPSSFTEKAGDVMGIFESQVKKDLNNFKRFIEEQGGEEGAWRGEVHGGVRSR